MLNQGSGSFPAAFGDLGTLEHWILEELPPNGEVVCPIFHLWTCILHISTLGLRNLGYKQNHSSKGRDHG